MKALLDAPDSLTRRILEKAGADAEEAASLTLRFIERQPKVVGATTQVLGRNLEALVDFARTQRDEAEDECVAPPPPPSPRFRTNASLTLPLSFQIRF